MYGEPLLDGHRVRRRIRVLDEVEVIPSGRVLEQVRDAYGVRVFPGILEGDVGRAIAHLVVERELSFLHELQDRERGEHLRNRADAKQRVFVRGPAGLHVRLAPARDPVRAFLADQRDADRRSSRVLADLFDPLLEFFERPGRFSVRAAGSRAGEQRGQQEEGGSHRVVSSFAQKPFF
jgi:hypothetical protein